jgi:hypothetical protein
MAAAPAVAGLAAAVCLAPQALADPAPAHAAAHSATATGALVSRDEEMLAAVKRAALTTATTAPARPASYTIRAGDSLSSIAGKVYHKQNAWPVLYWANRDKIRWANIVGEGQVLKVPAMPAKIPAAPSQLAPALAPPPAPAAAAAAAAAPVAASSAAPAQAASPVSSSYSGGASSSFESCVIARESGGNSQVMNSSGHYGLYQFSASTWVAYGGSAGDFGHASASEQHQVF